MIQMVLSYLGNHSWRFPQKSNFPGVCDICWYFPPHNSRKHSELFTSHALVGWPSSGIQPDARVLRADDPLQFQLGICCLDILFFSELTIFSVSQESLISRLASRFQLSSLYVWCLRVVGLRVYGEVFRA